MGRPEQCPRIYTWQKKKKYIFVKFITLSIFSESKTLSGTIEETGVFYNEFFLIVINHDEMYPNELTGELSKTLTMYSLLLNSMQSKLIHFGLLQLK